MVTANRPPGDLIQQAAALRVRGSTWEAVAAAVGRSVSTVRLWPTRFADEWATATREARRQNIEEAAAESVLTLRKQLRSDDDKTSRAAADALLKHTKAIAPRRRSRRRTRPSTQAQQMAEYVEGLSDEQATQLLGELLDASPASGTESAVTPRDSNCPT